MVGWLERISRACAEESLGAGWDRSWEAGG
jgi:hypothetical protein